MLETTFTMSDRKAGRQTGRAGRQAWALYYTPSPHAQNLIWQCRLSKYPLQQTLFVAQSAGAVEYPDCTSAEG